MKVLVISAAFPPMRAGEADHTLLLCRELARAGLDVDLVTAKGAGREPHRFRIHPIMRGWTWRETPRLLRVARKCKPDAVLLIYIGWIYHDHPMITFAPTLLRKILPETRVVTLFENSMGTRMEQCSLLMRAIRKGVKTWIGGADIDYEFGTLLRDSDRLIVMSTMHLAKLCERFRAAEEKATLIAPPPLLDLTPEDGLSRRRGREMLSVGAGEFLISYLGYVYPGKGIEALLKAFRIVSDHHPAVRLAMIGGVLARRDRERPFYADEMRALANTLGVSDKVTWTGEYPHGSKDPSLYLRGSDAFVFPGIFGIQLNNSSIAAAAVHGLPIITTRATVVEPPFVDGENMLACPPQDSESMARAILRVIEDVDLRGRLRAGASRLASEWYSLDRAVERTIETFSPTRVRDPLVARARGQAA